jgi:ABC-2 type transport system permease protein
VLSVVVLGYLCWVSYTYSKTTADVMTLIGGPMSLVPGVMFMATSLVVLITGIYQGGKTLFTYKDFDQLISLPVSVSSVAASRVLLLYSYDLLFSLLLMAPAGVVYVMRADPPPLFYLIYIIFMILAPVIPLIVSAIIGTIITALSSKLKKFGTAVNIILSIGAVAAFVFVPMMISGNTRALGNIIESLMDKISSRYPPTAMFISAIENMDMLSFISFVLISACLFVAFCLAVAVRYRQICSRVRSMGGSKKMKMEEIRQSGVLSALYRREIRRYFSSTIYVMNTSIGLILGLIACAVLLFGGGLAGIAGSGSDLGALEAVINQIAPAILSVLVCMSTTTGSSISLEGRGIWIVKSMPVKAVTAIWSKIMVNLTLTVPATLICGVLYAIAMNVTGTDLLLLFLVPLIFAVFAAVFGIYVNLKLPKMDWQNEAEVVKQSMSAMISMFGPAIIPIAAMILVGP